MTVLSNPEIKLKIYGPTTLEIKDLDMSFNIVKDLEDEPNEAEVTIYNLSEATRDKFTNVHSHATPIEIFLTEPGFPDFVRAFAGEIDQATNTFLRPGHETVLTCTSLKWTHKQKRIDKKTYESGTPLRTVVNDFLSAIALPFETVELPTAPILLSRSFSGPAFPLLKGFVEDLGYFCYILDGTVYITDIEERPRESTKTIKKTSLLSTPRETVRQSESLVKMQTIPSKKNPYTKTRRKKTTVTRKTFGKNGFLDVDVVDEELVGLELEMLCNPSIDPDDILILPEYDRYKNKFYRVYSVNHFGDNFGGDWTTIATTDESK